MSSEIFDLFRDLADSSDDYTHEGDTIIFMHHGKEHQLSLSHVPSVGPALRHRDSLEQWVPVATFIQREILGLPVLARQILRALERKHQLQGIRGFIDSTAQVSDRGENSVQTSAKAALQRFLQMPSYGSTQVIELMAAAGQGKTVLLEHLSMEAAKGYQPDPYPLPLLLVVDLLGRYVGTIHDAIAGSLSNTYTFPGLTGRDVTFCLRQRWLSLALDGFDELVARVGTREAFLRAKELIDDLKESGTVILSARDIFFDLFEIDASIRTYLQPRRGSYDIKAMTLKPWERVQGEQVFALLGAPDSQRDLAELLEAFQNDTDLVLRPFFTTRLAKAWLEGERFSNFGVSSEKLDRWNYVIRVFLEREATEKWKDRDDDSPLLNIEGHIIMLGALAEEMWRSSAFSLTKDEVEIAGRIGLNEIGLAPGKIDDLVTRLPTHGMLSSIGGKGVKFVHESFLIYLLGQQLGHSLSRHDSISVGAILKAGELAPLCIEWATWRVRKDKGSMRPTLTWLVSSNQIQRGDAVISGNIALLLGCAAQHEQISELELERLEFIGDALRGVKLTNVIFRECAFWLADLSQSIFSNCVFQACRLGNILLDEHTQFDQSKMLGCEFSGIELKGQAGLFAPTEIAALLQKRGALIEDEIRRSEHKQQARRSVDSEAIYCLDKLRRAKTWDISVEEIEERFGWTARQIYKAAVATGVMRESTRDTAGGRKVFVRFTVDRERLYSGQLGPIGDEKIDAFWDELERAIPDT